MGGRARMCVRLPGRHCLREEGKAVDLLRVFGEADHCRSGAIVRERGSDLFYF